MDYPRAAIVLLALALAGPAGAYIGPGAGISVLGSLLGVIATVFVALGAILFWPVRRMLKRRRQRVADGSEGSATQDSAP